MKNLLLAGLICLAAVLSCASTDAKPISKILSESGLSPDDFIIMTKQSATLYEKGTPSRGSTTKWQNDDTRSYGVVELVSVEANCVYLRHFVHPKGVQKAREIRMRRCKTSDGNWVMQ